MSERTRSRDDPRERFARVQVAELRVERPERVHLLLEVVKDDPIHPDAELRGCLPVPRVVREPASRGFELAGVEDELAGGPRAAGLGARGGLRVLMRDFTGGPRLAEVLARGAETRNRLGILLVLPCVTGPVAPVVGRVLRRYAG